MTIRLYLDTALTNPISADGDFSNPDTDFFDGTHGESKDRQLWVANDQAELTATASESSNVLNLSRAAFSNGTTIILGNELIRVLSGGDTLTPTVERGFAGSPVSSHPSGSIAYSAFDYADLRISPFDQTGTDERLWYRLALTQADLDTAIDGEPLSLGIKPHHQTLSFWRRITVPAATAVQTKVDLGLEITAIESPVQSGGA